MRSGFGGFSDSPGRLRPGRSAGFHWQARVRPTRGARSGVVPSDHLRSAGVEPIVPLEEAAPLAPVIRAGRV